MKKRWFMLLPLASVFALCLGVAAGCDETGAAHEHTWGEYTVIEEPTCETTGKHVRTCTVCGAEDPSTIMPALGHDWDEGKVTKEATCEGEGETTITCKRDPSHVKTTKIPALGHKWKVKEILKDPTCTGKGRQSMVCERDESHTKEIDISPVGHTWGEWVNDVPGSCVTDGHRYHICTVCNTKEGEDVPAKGHQYGQWTVKTPATCEERGVRVTTCTVCKDEVEQTIAQLGHEWGEPDITKEPKCDEKGSATYTCNICKETKTVDVPAPGHDWTIEVISEATAEAEGKQKATCETCHAEKESKIPFEKGIYRVVVKKLDGRVVRTKKWWDEPDTGNYAGSLVSFYNKDGVLVFEKHVDWYHTVQHEDFTTSEEHTPFVEVELPIQDYTIKLGNIPDGYYYKDTYEIKKNDFKKIVPDLEGNETVSDDTAVNSNTKATDPVGMDGEKLEGGKEKTLVASLDLTLVSHMSDSRLGNYRTAVNGYCGDIREGAVIPDCSWITTDNESIILSELLKEKKIVILDLYFYTCQNCKNNAPYFVEFANAFKDDIAVVCLNISDSSDGVCNSIRKDWNYPDWFYIVKDYQTKFYMNVEHGSGAARPGAPTQVVIDQGFCVAAIHGGDRGDRTGQGLLDCLPGDLGRDYRAELAKRRPEGGEGAVDSVVMPVMLPERKKLFN